MTLRTRRGVTALTLVAIGILIGSGVLSYRSTTELIRESDAREYMRQRLTQLNDLFSALKDAETGERGYVITGQTNFLEPVDAALPVVRRSIDELQSVPATEISPDELRSPDGRRPAEAGVRRTYSRNETEQGLRGRGPTREDGRRQSVDGLHTGENLHTHRPLHGLAQRA
ncbi:MAG TPA: CHASE3 domain-containing protein [Vicinamibacterales bacterium]|nr:CHASE3 domain-containing protein [Vicinamibacterales bacterium]